MPHRLSPLAERDLDEIWSDVAEDPLSSSLSLRRRRPVVVRRFSESRCAQQICARLLLQQLGVRPQLFEAQTSRVAARSTKPLEFELEQRVQVAPGVRGGDLLHDATFLFALGRIALEIQIQLLGEPPVDGAQAVLPQLLLPAGPLLSSTCRFVVSRFLLRGAVALRSAAELVCQLGGPAGPVLDRVRAHFRAQRR